MLRKMEAKKRNKMARKNRREEREERYERRGYGRDFVTGHDPMVGRDSHAGLPDQLVMEEYPRNKMMKGGRLDDTMSEIDAIQTDSERQVQRRLSHQK